MANTFTSNYNFIKSEIGGDNQSWGNNLHTTLDLTDTAIAKLIENQLISGITSAAIDLTASGSDGIISTSSNLKYFESVQVGDRIRVSGSSQAVNGTAAIPVVHYVKAKTSADSITVATNITTDTSSTITVAKVLEPVHINSGPIVCAPLTSLSHTTRAVEGCVHQPGTDTTDALVAKGDVTLGNDAAASGDTVTFTSRVASSIIPSADATYDLGAAGAEWQNLHITGSANVDSLVADTVAIPAGTIAGVTSVSVAATGITITGSSGDYSNFVVGSNGAGRRTISTSAPSGGTDGDIHYEYT